MACSLNKEQVLDVYEILYGEIIDRINDSRLPKFDLDQTIKDIYNSVKEATQDEVKALYYAQAVPDIFNLVKMDEEVNDYLVDNKFDSTALDKLRKDFKDLTEVGKALATKKKSKDEIDGEIKDANKSKKDFVETDEDFDIDNLLFWSYNQLNGARVTNAWTTSIQVAIAANPETVSEEDRNTLDPEKLLFSKVVKAIAIIARNRTSSTEPLRYEDVEIALNATLTTNIDNELLTSKDRKYLEEHPEDNGIAAVITDSEGNYLYFREDGSLTDNPEEGRIVYQYLRKVSLVDGKLLLSNRANRKYNLVEPEVLAERQKKKIEDNGGKVTKKQFEQLVKNFDERQKLELNTLYTLRKMLEENEDMSVLLPIVSGTMGIVSNDKITLTLQESGLKESDVKGQKPLTVGDKTRKGRIVLILQKEIPGQEKTEPFEVLVQRGDMNEEIAEKIATVLTTKAKYRGRELTIEERHNYFEVFVDNSVPTGENINEDRITVKLLDVGRTRKLRVRILDKDNNLIDLFDDEIYTEKSKSLIKNHLLNRKPIFLTNEQKKQGLKPGDNGFFPARISYNTKYLGKTFADYNVQGDVITSKMASHFDAIKDFIQIEVTKDLAEFEQGLNAYLTYSIPDGLLEDVSDIEVGRRKVNPDTKTEKKEKTEKTETPARRTRPKFRRPTDKEETKKKPAKKGKSKPKFTRKDATEKEKKETKEKNIKENPATRAYLLDDILNKSESKFKKPGLDRSKLRDSYFDRVFTSKADRAAAEKWWSNSPLSKHISLERITEIVNSDAFARWSGYGITLFEADGGTSVDLYHEAWHGFSQLFLTKDEKVQLYEEIQGLPKYKDKTFFDIEEDLAEQFRSYAKSKGKKQVKGFLSRMFDKIYKFLQRLFGKATKNDVATNLQDLDSVKELFDKLYRASEKPELLSKLTPSMDNVMFGELDRSKVINDNFSLQETKQTLDAVDSIAAKMFEKYNQDNNTSTAAIDILRNEEKKKQLYRDIYEEFETLRLKYIDDLEKDFELLSDPQFVYEYELLDKITDNFGGPNNVFDRNEKNNVIAYHREKTVFKILRDKYIEIEDPTSLDGSNLFRLKDDNSISAFKQAKEETLMLLSGLFKTSMENGVPVRSKGMFGLPELIDLRTSWNRLAKILQGSYDDLDMYARLFANSENYPELGQLLNILPNPYRIISGPEYSTREEFKLETSFWQDFKKPRIPFIQLNLEKEKGSQPGVAVYEARLAKANFDVYQVFQDWKNNFITADSTVNPYIEKKLGVNYLKTAEIVKDFGVNGRFNYTKSNEFLKAIGVVLDQSSVAIKEIINSTEEPFYSRFGLDRMYEVIKLVNKSNSPDALKFKKDPLFYLLNGIPESLREDEEESQEVRSRMRALAEIQNMFSDGYSNFSVQTPEGSRVWEHMVDNTVTRIVTAINFAENWQQLTTDEADRDGRFKHMRWLAFENNTFSPYSKLLNSIFDLDPMSSTFGQKISDTKITLSHVGGSQEIGYKGKGTSTASMDATSKYLQEVHTMLLNGVEEFMRHASKNTAMSMSVEGEILTYNGKNSKKLYVDIENFIEYADGEIKAYDIIEGYLAAEANRIVRFQQQKDKFKNYAGYNRKVRRKDNPKGKGTEVYAGQAFTAFDDILTEKTQEKLYKLLDKASDNPNDIFDLVAELDNNNDLRELIREDVYKYFNLDTDDNLARLEEAKYIDEGLFDRIKFYNPELTNKDVERALIKAYTYNSFIHKMETVALAYGDLVQYNHAKEEFHKRNAGLASGGKGFRSDKRAQIYLSSLKKYYADRMGFASRNYDGTLKTAIIKEIILPSKMYKEYEKEIYDSIYQRTKNEKLASELSKKAIEEYGKMKIADGQGWITFEAYRLLKEAEGNWSDQQEALYRKVAMGENITAEDVVEFFPSYKLQYFGNIESTGLPVTSFHKFSLAPLIPGVHKIGTPLYDLHQRMMEKKVDYVLMESGSKVSHIGTGDVVLNEDGTFNKKAEFTENTVFAEFLKNQTEVNQSYKEKSIFSTQLRKLILEGLYEKGVIKSTKYADITNTRVKRYINHVEEYTDLLKLELLEEMGYEETSSGQYKPKDKSSTAKLLNIIRQNLEREDLISDDLIEFIDVFDNSGELIHDLSFHPEASKIEKLLLSMINKRVIKQKVSGEPLIQVSVGMFANQFSQPDLKKATKDEIAKWASASYLLPTYHKKSNGYTAAAKVMIAMQGTYYNLFNLEYDNGETVGVYNENGELNMDQSLKRLNEKIKDDKWLDANNGANRKAITLVGVRIPVQGLNSMEFAEVFEFLPPQAGNIIVPPAEIVAKSGGDFDIDKLTIFMNTLDEEGKVIERQYKDNASIKKLRGTDQFDTAVKAQKAGLENELINDIKELLELPDNYASLIMPNGTFILKGLADELSKYVSKYNAKKTKMTKETGEISPTRVLESLYNIYKHESNIVGKNTLGLGAIENTFNVIMNAIGAYMPDTYIANKIERKSNMRLRHNKMTDKNGKEVISMSDMYDVDGIYKVADVISQMMNGWVDVEKDAWVFFIQGNYEVAPTLIYMIKAGVPVEEAVYFVSNPLVREYVNEQRLYKSTFSNILGRQIDSPGLAKYNAAGEVITKYFTKTELGKYSKSDERYTFGQKLLNKYFEKRTKKHFTLSEMKDLVEDNDFTKKKLDQAKAMFLHYLELEDQIKGYTKLKMSFNPDTSTKSTISDVEYTESNIEEIFNDSRVPQEVVENMKNNSILKSFFNGQLALAVSRPLFKLRFHPEISDFLISVKDRIRNDVNITFPGQTTEMFNNVFRNDLVSFILQNAIRKYQAKNSFMSLDLETDIPLKMVKELSRGAFVKDGVLYMDMKKLKKEFKNKAWEEDSDVENSYADRGLYALDPSTFMTDNETNFDEYLKFVAQREYLRFLNPLTKEFAKTKEFQEELETTKENFEDLTQEKAVRYTYEKLLAIKALDNSYNLYHLFQSENAFAIRLAKLIENNPNLVKNYPVLNKLKLDGGQEVGVYNVLLAEKDFDNDLSNLYTDDLAKLSNPGIAKVQDPVENLRISNMFKYLNMYAFLQTGLNKTKLNFTNVVDFNDFLTIVENEAKSFISALESNGQAILSNFYEMFVNQNNKRLNPNKDRYKNYLSDMDLKTVKKPEVREEDAVKPTGTINVYWGQAESKTSTKILSNLAPRTFTWKGREYGSVEHAYQSNKSGTFDQATYDKYVKVGGYGTKIRGKAVQQGFDNLQLMKDLVVESFLQNPNSEAAAKLLQYEKFTHNTNEIIDKAFLEGLKLAQQRLLPSQQQGSVEVVDKYTVADLKANPNKIYIFGDNITEKGKGGQAIIRDEENAFGIPTKVSPNTTPQAYFNDNKYEANIGQIDRAIEKIKADGRTVVLPKDGLGTGLAKLKEKAPDTYDYLKQRLLEEFGFDNDTGQIITTQPQVEDIVVEEKRLGLKLTDEDRVYTYNDKNAKNSYYYANLAKNNSDVVFLHNTSIYEIRPEQRENETILGGSSYFMSEAPNMSINFPTDLFSHVENGKRVDLPSSEYEKLKQIWERRIAEAKEIQEKNGKIAFPEYGFGNKETMPQELFVYLSKRLFEEFKFVNPGSTKYEQIMKMVGETQGITDDEILRQLELEEDPFKCA